MTYPPLNSTGDWYEANWYAAELAHQQRAADAAVKKRDAALDLAIAEAFRDAGAIYDHPSAAKFREVLAKHGLCVLFGGAP